MLQIAFARCRLAPMRYSRFFLPLLALALIAAASKPKLTIRFYTEANASSGSGFTMSAQMPDSARKLTLSKIAQISEGDIVAIYPFPVADGTIGCSFKLDLHGKVALDSLSSESHGGLLVGFVNGRAVTAMVIDRRVSDGIITIPSGLTPAEVEMMRKNFPTLGEKKSKKGAAKSSGATLPTMTPFPTPQRLPSSTPAPRGD